MKKVLIGICIFLILLIGGANIFVHTKSDFIIEKVSELLEQNLHAKLTMQELPKLSVFPSLSVKAGTSSLTSKDFTITFDNASVNISLFKLISGTVQINSVALDTLDVKYTAPQENIKTKKQDKNQKNTSSNEQSLEEIFNLIPANILIKNSNIFYKDKDQELYIKNLNAEFDDFGINKNSSTKLEGEIIYKDKKLYKQFKILSDIDFLFMGSSIEYTINNFNFTPIKGLLITKPVDITAKSAMNFNPISIENIDATIKSPFVDLKIIGTGDDREGNINLTGEIYPLTIQEFFEPNSVFYNIPQKADINSNFILSREKITVKSFVVEAPNGKISMQGFYDILKKNIDATLLAENLKVHDYLVKETKKSTQKTNSQHEKNTTQKQTQKNDDTIKLTFNVKANAKNIQYNGLTIDTITSNVKGIIDNKQKIININPLTITSNKEDILVTAKLELEPKDLITVTYDIPKLTAKHWIKAVGNDADLDALINSKGSITLKTSNPIATLNGKGQLNGSSLKIYTKLLPFIANILKASPKIEDSYEFNTLSAPYTIKNGVVSTNAYVDSPVIFVNSNGYANLNNELLNFAGNVELRKQHLVFPYKVTGSFNNPNVGIDLGKQLQILGGGLLHGGQAIGGGIIDGGKTVGGGVVEGGKVIGGGLVKGGKALGKGLNDLFK